VGGEDADTELARTRALCENYIGKPAKSFDFPLAALFLHFAKKYSISAKQ
jgi:hypothetical protein